MRKIYLRDLKKDLSMVLIMVPGMDQSIVSIMDPSKSQSMVSIIDQSTNQSTVNIMDQGMGHIMAHTTAHATIQILKDQTR